ncbi:MAG: OsmC family protein [Vicinamibacterales bacterium]|nr:OsmC family protein [Vicinamibacterales bacterium]
MEKARVSEHRATIHWRMGEGTFLKGRYSREHTWAFDGGVTVPASPSPSVVPLPYSNPAHVDPEEAFVAAIASCHMLTFLHLASRAGYDIAAYQDDAVGEMSRNAEGRLWVSRVTLAPRIDYVGIARPDAAAESALHHAAHEECFIANSVRTEILVRPPVE